MRAPWWRSAVVLVLAVGLLAVPPAGGSGASAAAGPPAAAADPGPQATDEVPPIATSARDGHGRSFTPIVSLVLREQPRTATLNTALDPPPVVAVVDAAGNPAPDAGVETVEVALRTPPGVLSPLGGRTSVPVVDGEAVLDDLRIRTTGEGYHLDVEAALGGTWLEVTSEPFTVVAAEPPRAGHVDAVDCVQAGPGAALLHLDGRRAEVGLTAADDGRGVRFEHPALAPSLSVPATDASEAATVSGATLLLDAADAVSVRADGLLPGSPVGVWLVGDPPCPLAAAGAVGSAASTLRNVGRDRVDAPDDATDDAAMVEVTPIGTLTATAAGAAEGRVALPAGLTPGVATVQLVGTLADGSSMVAAAGVLVTPPRFADVQPASVHAPAIRRIAALDITDGRQDGTYGPDAAVTRGQMASFLARALALDTHGSAPFPDAAGTVHEGAVAAVAEAGIARGLPDGSFGVGTPIRRDQMASMLAAAAGLDPKTQGPFDDVAGSVHAPAINAVAAAGIALGDGQGRFLPGAPVRRDQMASFLVRLLDHEGCVATRRARSADGPAGWGAGR